MASPRRCRPTRSFELSTATSGTSVLAPYFKDLASLQSCLQCGICTATCNLAGDDGDFPRRQITLARLGLQDDLVADPDIWRCYGCSDCTSHCPSGVTRQA